MATCANPECGSTKVVAAGYCSGCYTRLRRRGTVQRAYVVNSGQCSVEGCESKSFAKNLCQRHYNQAENPLKRAWKNLRARYPGEYPERWNRFVGFEADVPPAPPGAHQLRRTRANEPWGPANMHWLVPLVTAAKPGMSRREYNSKYSKVWNDRKKYGVEPHQRAELMEKQGGVCAICREAETIPNPHDPERKPRQLNIDHDHRTGAVRGLLCVRCNTIIGRRGADDSIDLLRAAIAYLTAHAVDGAAG